MPTDTEISLMAISASLLATPVMLLPLTDQSIPRLAVLSWKLGSATALPSTDTVEPTEPPRRLQTFSLVTVVGSTLLPATAVIATTAW